MVNLISIFAFIYLSRSINNIKSRFITLISIGTLLIFGLHRMMIGVIDYIIEKALNTTDITYDWYECIAIAIGIEIILLPIIIYRGKWPILFGKSAQKAPSI